MTSNTMTATEQRAYVRKFAAELLGNFIDGRWIPASATETIDVFDPSTGERLGEVAASSEADVHSAVVSARAAQAQWACATPAARSQLLFQVAAAAQEHFEQLMALECVDSGKPVTAVRDDELPGVIDAMRYFAGAGRTLSAQAGGDYLDGITSVMRREPLGVVAGITPWNYPLLQ